MPLTNTHSAIANEFMGVQEVHLDDVGEHGVEGGDEDDPLFCEERAHDLENVLERETEERVVQSDVRILV